MKLDNEKASELGASTGLTPSCDIMRYVAGVVTRERERLARVFESHGQQELAADIRSPELNDKVFKWEPPSAGLDAAPRSVAERQAKKEADKAAKKPG